MTAFSYGHHGCISPAANKLLAGEGAAHNHFSAPVKVVEELGLHSLIRGCVHPLGA